MEEGNEDKGPDEIDDNNMEMDEKNDGMNNGDDEDYLGEEQINL